MTQPAHGPAASPHLLCSVPRAFACWQVRAPTHCKDLCGFHPPFTKHKLNVTEESYLGQCKAETREEKCLVRYFCASLASAACQRFKP